MRSSLGRRIAMLMVALLAFAVLPYVLLPWYSRCAAPSSVCNDVFPGDQIVSQPRAGYTLATIVRATATDIWPWLLQMGQGRGGFYTYEAVEGLLGADIHNADSIIPGLQHLTVGDTVRLTPDPYLGGPGQFLVVAAIEPARAIVLRQSVPNGSTGTWVFVLEPLGDGATRLLFRRRAGQPSFFDRLMGPGYVFMDRGMLRGIRERAETNFVDSGKEGR